jgi:hypothetical protein
MVRRHKNDGRMEVITDKVSNKRKHLESVCRYLVREKAAQGIEWEALKLVLAPGFEGASSRGPLPPELHL